MLQISDGNLVKTVQFNNPRYLGDPVNAVKIFNLKQVDELMIIDIDATKYAREPNFKLLEDIANQAFMPLSYGGGIKTVDQMRKIFSIGYEKVIINTEFINNPLLIREASDEFGSQSIVVSIDVKKIKNGAYRCSYNSGRENLEESPESLARKACTYGAGEIVVYSIDNDGMMNGYDLNLIKEISNSVSVPVIACGGAKNINDLSSVISQTNAHAVAAGSMFVYYGRLNAVLINMPSEQELINANIYCEE